MSSIDKELIYVNFKFIKAQMEIVNNHMQIYLNSFVNQKMQTRVTMKSYFMPIRVVKLRELKYFLSVRVCGKGQYSFLFF